MEKKNSLKNDIPASIVVFLVALPLCLGIALASGAPLISGLIAGVIGGIVVGFISGSHTSVSGPAAGLATIVLSSIGTLGGFEYFLAALFFAGIIQFVLGLLKTGIIADYIPNSVIKGLLASIGILLILKQIPHAIGYDKDPEGDFAFSQTDGENTFSELINMLDFVTPGALIIASISILLLIYWKKLPIGKLKSLPSSLIVVLLSVVINSLIFSNFDFLTIEKSHLVSLPDINPTNIQESIFLPNFSLITNANFWIIAFTIALVASIETLLNLEAVDKIDPHKRLSPPNRELLAQGLGNMVSGLIGGLPVTSVIVRSSVNINSNAQTKNSAIFHGILLLLSIFILKDFINLIPLSCLAALLIVTGYKLANANLFKEMWRKGFNQFIPFMITILAIVFTDLLIGILIGLATGIIFVLIGSIGKPFKKGIEMQYNQEIIRFDLASQISFMNKSVFKKTLWEIPKDSMVIIDAYNTQYIDDDILELIHDFRNTVSREKQIQLNIWGLKNKYSNKNLVEDQVEFVNFLDKEKRENLSPIQILDILKDGNNRFATGEKIIKNFKNQIDVAISGQNPMAVVIACIDSRTSPEMIFDVNIGDILTIRIAGNVISPYIIASLEIAVRKLGTKLIVVKGHSNCGAIDLAVSGVKDGNIGILTQEIESAINLYKANHQFKVINTVSEKNIVSRINVFHSIQRILNESEYIKQVIEEGKVGIVAAFHDLGSGHVLFNEMNDYTNKKFLN